MIDKEEEGGKEKPPIYFGELYADVSYQMGSNSAIFIYFYFSVTVVSVKWCRCLLQVSHNDGRGRNREILSPKGGASGGH